MLYLNKNQNINGTHASQITFAIINNADWLPVPAELEVKTIGLLPYINITIVDNKIIDVKDNTEARNANTPSKLDTAKQNALSRIDGRCSGAIYNGLDIGNLHYNFTPTSQTNLETIARLSASGQKSFLYRADNETEQRIYTDVEMNVIIRTKDEWITINTNYYELLKQWISRETDILIIKTINYGEVLPNDLMLVLKTRCEAIGIDISKYMIMFAGN